MGHPGLCRVASPADCAEAVPSTVAEVASSADIARVASPAVAEVASSAVGVEVAFSTDPVGEVYFSGMNDVKCENDWLSDY